MPGRGVALRDLWHRLVYEMRMEAGKFTNYFLAYVKPEEIPQDSEEKRKFLFGRPGVLELCQYDRAQV